MEDGGVGGTYVVGAATVFNTNSSGENAEFTAWMESF